MKTLFILFVLFVSSSAFALGPAPYIGASLQGNFPTGDFSGKNGKDFQAAAKTNGGGEIDLGITGSGTSFYLGYRFSNHNTDTEKDSLVPTSWKTSRFLAGLRFHIFGDTQFPLVPTIGGGLSIGATKADIAEYDANHNSIRNFTRTAKTSLGWFAEIGALLRIPKTPLSAIADLQYHSFDAKFSDQLFNQKFNISFVTAQLGLRYTL